MTFIVRSGLKRGGVGGGLQGGATDFQVLTMAFMSWTLELRVMLPGCSPWLICMASWSSMICWAACSHHKENCNFQLEVHAMVLTKYTKRHHDFVNNEQCVCVCVCV